MKTLFCCLLLASLTGGSTAAFAGQLNDSTLRKNFSSAATQFGIASFYSNKFQGKPTANGELFDQQKMTCAHNSLPFGTWLKVTNLRNNRSVVVRVNDRLNYHNHRLVDLSRSAAGKLGYVKHGLARVKVQVLGKKRPPEDLIGKLP
ncbi:MAG: septal ring lytic transglycosylase RlpA family protein [Bacteroidetes bacterium]|nr:septal ring lytic transglycosylase RlpA family protein [Bacteroidota bacterium]